MIVLYSSRCAGEAQEAAACARTRGRIESVSRRRPVTAAAAIDVALALPLREKEMSSSFFSLTRDRLAEPVGGDLGGRHCFVFVGFVFLRERKGSLFAVPGKLCCEAQQSRPPGLNFFFFLLRLPPVTLSSSRERALRDSLSLGSRHKLLSNVQKSHLRVDPPPDRRWPG